MSELGIMRDRRELDYDSETECWRCDGSGELMVCCDDICVGAGECMHGDGDIICPSCGGSGVQPA